MQLMNFLITSGFGRNTDCDVVVEKSGNVIYASWGHINKMIEISGESERDIFRKMPLSATPIRWMVDYTGCVSVHGSCYVVPTYGMTKEQKHVVNTLIRVGMLKDRMIIGEKSL